MWRVICDLDAGLAGIGVETPEVLSRQCWLTQVRRLSFPWPLRTWRGGTAVWLRRFETEPGCRLLCWCDQRVRHRPDSENE